MAKARRAISLRVSVIVVIALILVVGFGVYLNDTFNTSNTATSVFASNTSSSTSSGSASVITTQNTTSKIILSQGTTYQVQSSYDCVAGHFAQPFNITTISYLEGGINVTNPGVTVYVSTTQQAQTTNLGHPIQWAYSANVTNSTTFKVILPSGSYVLWIEGADMGCGATIVTPLEQLTVVTVTQAIMVTPES